MEIQHYLERFEPIVSSLSKKVYVSRISDSDDVRQMCIERLLSKFDEVNKKPEEEVFRYVRVMLCNHLRNKKRDEFDVPGLFDYSNLEIGFIEDIISNVMVDCYNSMELEQEKSIFFEDLKKEILDWSKKQKNEIRNFIKEFLNPSSETQKIWKDRQAKSKRKNGYEYIPPYRLAKILGISDKKWCEASKKLKKYLISRGYVLT